MARCGLVPGPAEANVVQFGRPAEQAYEESAVTLPLYGRIAAGTPIEALRDHSTQVQVPPHLLGCGDHYALEVVGDSMCEAGIQDGDLVVIERADGAANGDIVVALIDDAEVTLKRLRCKGQTVALEAGLSAGEQVVTDGALYLEDGEEVTLAEPLTANRE